MVLSTQSWPRTADEFRTYLRQSRNWNRWGAEDQRGALNLVTPEKTVAASRLVRDGLAVSLSRPFPTAPGPGNPVPAQHFMGLLPYEDRGAAVDHVGVACHGIASTHIDALCHMWDLDGMWNGRRPEVEIGFDGAAWGGIDRWATGLVTRGVLLDVPRYRGEPYVTLDRPVTDAELWAVAEAEGVGVGPGDAVAVYCGREAWSRANPVWGSDPEMRPGLHASCVRFLRETDVAALVWDMTDARPSAFGWAVHSAIFAFGLALVDSALLEPLADACTRLGRWEFLLVVAPLPIAGGTGCAVNPLALL